MNKGRGVMEEKIKELSETIKNIDLKDKSDVKAFVTNYTALIYNHQMVGLIYDFYDENIEILKETTTRQGFYAHTPDYFRNMWQELKDSGMMKIFNAVYEEKVLVSWIVFLFDGVLYYPYGASRRENRDVMASNLMMWEMIRFGKKENCKSFDMWGSLGPKPDPKNPWFGFHRFKKGYGGQLREFIGTYDLVLDPTMYPLFRKVDKLRWKFLRLRKKIGL